MCLGGNRCVCVHVCDTEGEEGLRWKWIIKAAMDVSKAALL